MPTESDEIRDYVRKKYVDPARRSGQRQITVVAGDIHTELGLKESRSHGLQRTPITGFADRCGYSDSRRSGTAVGA